MIYIYKSVYNRILETFSNRPPEVGGVLGAEPNMPISEFNFDETGTTTQESYTPDCDKINEVLEKDWFPRNIYMVGIIHSHDASCPFPSCGDLLYAERIYRSLDIDDDFYIPIFNVGTSQIHWYSIKKQVDGLLKIKEEQVKYLSR